MTELDDLKRSLRDNLSVCLSMDSNGKTRRGLQHFSSLKFKDRSLQMKYELLLRHAHLAETRCPGSGLLFIERASGLSNTNDKFAIKTKSDLVKSIKKLGISSRYVDLLVETLEHANSSTKLSIKKSATAASYIEIAEGYSFTLKMLLKFPYLELKNCKALCIDGYVENVSEIHHIMTSIAEEKTPCIFFVRGMSNDVLHTISVNLERKTAMVYPYVVPFDVENVNTMVDLAVVCNTDVVSSLKGDLISSSTYEKLGNMYDCIISSQDIRFKNDLSTSRVKQHIQELKKTLSERPELEEILSKRIRSLSSSCIDICIPDDMNFYSASQQLDEGIRLIVSAMKNDYNPGKIAEETYAVYSDQLERTQTFLLES